MLTTIDPTAVQRRIAERRAQYVADLKPVGPVEHFLAREAACRAVQMERWEEAAFVFQEIAARQFTLAAGLTSAVGSQAVTVQAMICQASERAERIGCAHSRGFYCAIQNLLRMQAQRRAANNPLVAKFPKRFDSEPKCLDYLAIWRLQNYQCQRCGQRQAHFIPARPCVECVNCRAQTGLRSGTVMADSPLPLLIWFRAIWFVLGEPTLTPCVLQQRLKLDRRETARTLLNRVKNALIDAGQSELLADLDRYFISPECSEEVPENMHIDFDASAEVRAKSQTLSSTLLNPSAFNSIGLGLEPEPSESAQNC